MKRHILKSIVKNKVQSFGIFAIVMLAVILGTVFTNRIINSTKLEATLEKYNVEDFMFYINVDDKGIDIGDSYLIRDQDIVDQLEHEYDFISEFHKFKVFRDEKNTIYRAYSSNRVIDIPYYFEGEGPSNENEIAIDYKYSQKHNYKIGDELIISEESYIICGLMLLPDMIYPIIDNQGALYNSETQCLMLVTETLLDKMEGDAFGYYSAKFNNKNADVSSTIDLIQKDDQVSYIISKEDNQQILGYVLSKNGLYRIILISSLSMMTIITLIIMFMSIDRDMDRQLRSMGILRAIGYRRREIVTAYSFYGTIVFVGSIIGVVLGKYLIIPFSAVLDADVHVPDIKYQITLFDILWFVLFPTVLMGFFAMYKAMKNLKKTPLEMLNDRRNSYKISKITDYFNEKSKNKNFLYEVQVTTALNNKVLLILTILAGFAMSAMTLFSLITYNMTGDMVNSALNGIKYESDTILLREEEFSEKSGQQSYYNMEGNLIYQNKEIDNVKFIILYPSNELLVMHDYKTDNKIDYQNLDGLIINQWMANKYGLNVNDVVSIKIGEIEAASKIAAINHFMKDPTIYLGIEYAEKLCLVDSELRNGFYSLELEKFDEKYTANVMTTADIKNIMENSQLMLNVASIVLISFAFVMGSVFLIVTFNLVIEDNKYSVSILKINGYTKKEVNNVFFGFYKYLVFIGFLLGIPYSVGLSTIMFGLISKTSTMIWPVEVSWISLISAFVITISVFKLIMTIYKYKLNKARLLMIID